MYCALYSKVQNNYVKAYGLTVISYSVNGFKCEAMNVRYSFAFTVFLCSFGIFFLFVFTQAWFKMSQRTCASFNITLTSTKIFKDAMTVKKKSNWINDFQPVANDDIQVYSAYIEGQRILSVFFFCKEHCHSFQ